MSISSFHFDSSQGHQLRAIQSAVDLFRGQPRDAESIVTSIRIHFSASRTEPVFDLDSLSSDLSLEIGAVGNNLLLKPSEVLTNLKEVQERNGVEVSDGLVAESFEFDFEMETGTGKTYVYLRTALEFHKKFGFSKFIVVVPRKAIKEGVITAIRQMRDHLSNLYGPFDAYLYDGANPEQVQGFATGTLPTFLIVSIDSMKRDGNVIFRPIDRLNGLAPIQFLKAIRPVVIVDEPQLMESELAVSAIDELEAITVLRYSATHRKERNVVYRLDPVDAHDLGLVKQIVVAEVSQSGADATPYLRLIKVDNNSGKFSARMELACRNSAGTIARKERTVSLNTRLEELTGNLAYEGLQLTGMRVASDGTPGEVETNLLGLITEGSSKGSSEGSILREMIRETIREHFKKEAQLREKKVKVLSLFFVDHVARFLGSGSTTNDANGEFVSWFDDIFIEERDRNEKYLEIFPLDPISYRRGIFTTRRSGGADKLVDSTERGSAYDEETFKLIMREKETLLDPEESTRFIFSHSMLGVGWDNPNVFQICSLREMSSEIDRRQTIGRGLRLPVAKTPTGFVRINDQTISTLTVIANESYQSFAKGLQTEYANAGVRIGFVRPQEFAGIRRLDKTGGQGDDLLGYSLSKEIYEHLTQSGYLKDGNPTDKFNPDSTGFSLNLPAGMEKFEQEVIGIISKVSIERYVQRKSRRQVRTLNKEAYFSQEFEDFWREISAKTRFRVAFDRDTLVAECVRGLRQSERIDPLRIEVKQAKIQVLRSGASSEERSVRAAEFSTSFVLPNAIRELQESTSLTPQTLTEILTKSGRLGEFIANPSDFLSMAERVIRAEISKLVVAGVEYERIAGSIYELRELRQDAASESERFINQLYKVTNIHKTDFDYIPLDSLGAESPERQFAQLLDGREDISFFMKLPPKFRIPTPVGSYNPDWAIVKEVEGNRQLYLIRETKSTNNDYELRPSERDKIISAKRHFEAIGLADFSVSHPGQWAL